MGAWAWPSATRALEIAARACAGATRALEMAARACPLVPRHPKCPLGRAPVPPERSKSLHVPKIPASSPLSPAVAFEYIRIGRSGTLGLAGTLEIDRSSLLELALEIGRSRSLQLALELADRGCFGFAGALEWGPSLGVRSGRSSSLGSSGALAFIARTCRTPLQPWKQLLKPASELHGPSK